MSPSGQGFSKAPSSLALGSGALQDLRPQPGLCHEAADTTVSPSGCEQHQARGSMFVKSAAAAGQKGAVYKVQAMVLAVSPFYFHQTFSGNTFLLTAKTYQRPAAQATIPPGAFSSFVNTDLSRPFSQGHLGLPK